MTVSEWSGTARNDGGLDSSREPKSAWIGGLRTAAPTDDTLGAVRPCGSFSVPMEQKMTIHAEKHSEKREKKLEKQMPNTTDIVPTPQRIQSLIREVRGWQVMLDRDLAALYGVTTGNLNRAVSRNLDRFPEDFCFRLTKEEFLIFQNGTSSWGGTRKLPYAFTEYGVAMLAGLLKNERAAQINIEIVRAFVLMRRLLTLQTPVAQELADIKERVAALECRDRDNAEHIDDIYAALTELARRQKQADDQRNRPKIGFEV